MLFIFCGLVFGFFLREFLIQPLSDKHGSESEKGACEGRSLRRRIHAEVTTSSAAGSSTHSLGAGPVSSWHSIHLLLLE